MKYSTTFQVFGGLCGLINVIIILVSDREVYTCFVPLRVIVSVLPLRKVLLKESQCLGLSR